jgi:hypothetical protein
MRRADFITGMALKGPPECGGLFAGHRNLKQRPEMKTEAGNKNK